MRFVQHPSNNRVLGAPAGWDQSQATCNALCVTDVDCNGTPAVVSYWQPTAEDIAAMQAGAYVQLWVVGTTMPPVAVEVGR